MQGLLTKQEIVFDTMTKLITLGLIGLVNLVFIYEATACSPSRPESYTREISEYVFAMILESRCSGTRTQKEITQSDFLEFDSKSRNEKREYIRSLSDPICVEKNQVNSRHKILDINDPSDSDVSPKKILQFTKSEWEPKFATGKDGTVYNQSGLYRKGDGTKPLWIVDWYTRNSNFYVSNDGRNLARLNNTSYGKGKALEFYDNGILIRKYLVNELIRDTDNIWSELDNCFGGRWVKEASLTDDDKIKIDTRNQEYYVFDIKTGEMVAKEFKPMLSVRAKVLMKDNESIEVSKFTACGGFATVQRLQGNEDSVFGIYGTMKEDVQKDEGLMKVFIIPFHSIKLVSHNSNNNENLSWHVELKNGKKMNDVLIEQTTNYCGEKESGEKITLEPKQIKSILFY